MSGSPVHDIYDELHNRIRNQVFHAKEGRAPFLPQDLSRRSQVLEAKQRYSRLYLALASSVFGASFPTGGTTLATAAKRVMAEAANGASIGFTSDPTPATATDSTLSPSGEPTVMLPARKYADPRGSDYEAVIAEARVDDLIHQVPSVGRIATIMPSGEIGMYESLEGRFGLEGFDQCQFVFSHQIAGYDIRRSKYAS